MAAAKPMFSDESASDSGSGSGSSSSSSSSDSDSKAKAKEDSSKNVVSGKPTDTFTVNRQYAERFEHNKRREETHRLAEKVKREYIIRPGDIGEDSDSDTSSSESDEGDVPVKFDTQFAKALLRIKNKDPAIYDEEKALFSDDDDDDVDEAKKERKKKAPKKQTLRQVTAAQLLEGGAEALEQEEQEMLTLQKTTTGRSYVEEQADLKNAFKHAAGIDGTEAATMGKSKKKFIGKSQDAMDSDSDSDSASDSDSGGLKVKRRDVGFLGDDGGSSDDDDADEAGTQKAAEAKARLGEFFGTEKASDKNEQWRDGETGSEDGKSGFTYNKNRKDKSRDGGDSEDDAQAFDDAEKFEQKYNFRFEEPDGGMIVSHARTIEGTVRKDSTTRRDARASRNERKVSEKERLRGEVRRLKNLKREEIRAKMAQIAQVGGLAGADAIAAADLNSEFDPVAHDKLMSRMYDEQYYSGVLLDENGEELSKPEFGDLDDEVNEALGKATETEGGAADDSERFKKIRAAMLSASSSKGPQFEGDQGDDIDDEWEADGDEDEDEETGAQGADGDEGNNEGNKFSKRASKRWKKELMENMDEYYALDAEDFIDDVPCRFKYKEVAPSMFGLSTKDILEMSDRQLTQIVPLKKLAPYRHDADFTTAPKEKMRSQRMAREFLTEAALKGKGYQGKKAYDEKLAKGGKSSSGRKMTNRERKGKAPIEFGHPDFDPVVAAATAAEDRTSSYGPRAWGKYNIETKGKGKRPYDDVGHGSGGGGEGKRSYDDVNRGEDKGGANGDTAMKQPTADDDEIVPGSGKNAKKNLKKRQKKNEMEKAKAAGMV